MFIVKLSGNLLGESFALHTVHFVAFKLPVKKGRVYFRVGSTNVSFPSEIKNDFFHTMCIKHCVLSTFLSSVKKKSKDSKPSTTVGQN